MSHVYGDHQQDCVKDSIDAMQLVDKSTDPAFQPRCLGTRRRAKFFTTRKERHAAASTQNAPSVTEKPPFDSGADEEAVDQAQSTRRGANEHDNDPKRRRVLFQQSLSALSSSSSPQHTPPWRDSATLLVASSVAWRDRSAELLAASREEVLASRPAVKSDKIWRHPDAVAASQWQKVSPKQCGNCGAPACRRGLLARWGFRTNGRYCMPCEVFAADKCVSGEQCLECDMPACRRGLVAPWGCETCGDLCITCEVALFRPDSWSGSEDFLE